LRALGRSEAALAAFDAALALCPGAAGIHLNRGNLLGDLGRLDAALDAYDRAVALRPDYVEAFNNRGSSLMSLGRHDLALASFDAALRLRPDSPVIHLNRGLALRELGRCAEAVASYDRALTGQPDSVAALYNRGNALAGLGRHEEALAGVDAALAVQPEYEAAQINRSLTLKILRRYDEAVAGYQALIARQPDHAEAHTYLGICHLLFGRLRPGWAEYHWRWKSAGFPVVKRDFTQPLWRGDSLGGRTILLHSEQGLGDTLQFCRFIPRVAAQGGRVVLEAEESLLGLLGGLGVAQLVAKGTPLPAFDCHCPLLSLPLAFDIDLASIPAPRRYLSGDGARVAHWADRLGPATRPRIGLVWRGNSAHTNDANRSLGLADFLPLLSDGVEIISLQKEVRAADRLVLRAHPQIRHYGADLADLSDTAALCDLVDLVISVDTAVAHLAGALGRPVWIVLPHTPDWRWLLDRTDSPWYPSATLYRRGRDEDWAAVIARLGGDLGRAFAPNGAGRGG
jgi:lipoprotein NlpI